MENSGVTLNTNLKLGNNAGGIAHNAVPLQPVVQKYYCYRAYLADYFAYKKTTRMGFSYRRFAALAGLKSPNYLQLVMQGKRNLSEAVAETIADVATLAGPEKTYFLTLVRLENAKTNEEKEEIRKTQLAAIKQLVTVHIPPRNEKLLAQWYHLVVRELVFLKNFEPTGDFISKQLNGLVSPEQAENSLALLLESGLLRWNDHTHRYEACDVVLDTGNHLLRRHLMDCHHRETLEVWASNLPSLNSQEQERGLLNIPISSEKLGELREKIRQFQDELIGWLQTEDNPDRIVQLGIYLMPFGEPQRTPNNSTSNNSVAFGGITPPAPRAP